MYAAVLEFKSWVGTEVYLFLGKTVRSVVYQFEQVQSLSCLVSMGRMEEDEEGRKELDKIAAFLKKYHTGKLTIEDLKAFTFSLSVGSFRCVEAAEGDESVAALKEGFLKHPGAQQYGKHWKYREG